MVNIIKVLGLGFISVFALTNAAFADAVCNSDAICSDAIALPEPASMTLFAVGAAGLALAWKRKRGK